MKRNRRRTSRVLAILLLSASTPFSMGGCPELQDEIVAAFETATQSIFAAAITAYFEQYRAN